MALTKYREKRSFSETPEPTGGKSGDNDLKFVIQKHAASHLHYDFRLEVRGVLKSWAVPKGPSTDPAVKRLAMMVEDHPYDYRTFEGIIPQGQYGGGTVIVWDEGNFNLPESEGITDKKAVEKFMINGIAKGKLHFIMHGKKLKGEYALVKTHGRAENAWLLMKIKDKFVSTADITKKDKSVLSGKTLAQVEKSPENIYGQAKKAIPATGKKVVPAEAPEKKVKTPATKKQKLKKLTKDVDALIASGKKSLKPVEAKPMLATLGTGAFDKDDWIYEIKWDGYRAMATLNKGKAELVSRNNKSFDEKFYSVFKSLQDLSLNAVFDGEIIVADDEGKANFGQLQNWRSEADGHLLFYVFDILWYEGMDLTGLPLRDRKTILTAVLPQGENILLSEAYETSGIEFFAAAQQMGLEGIMAKKADSEYFLGARTTDWLKIKTALRHEVVIGGYTRNDGTAKAFSSLLVGVYEKKNLVYTGKIGTGFNDKTQREMMELFKPLVTDKPPFDDVPDINKPSRFRPNPPNATATWLKPELVCEVSYTELTTDGIMRHPSFEGMRTDKPAKKVEKDKQIEKEKDPAAEKPITVKGIKAPKVSGRKSLLNPSEDTQVKKVNGKELKFTNLSKLYWPEDKITKRDMLNYYYRIAPFILPYLRDRPQSLNRFPNGIHGMSFYQKDVTGKVPEWVEKFPYVSEGENKNFMLCNDEAALLYMASLGAIEMNPWSSTTDAPDNPDWCLIDLDPDKNHFDQVIETALVTKELLDAAGAESYCKTSGSTGLHIYIPLKKKYTYEESKEFARVIATMVHERLPKFTSIERATVKRRGKLYIDFLQNRPSATLAAAYSLRPKPGATVSMPLLWEEVKKGLKMADFNIHNAADRAEKLGDIFKPVFGKGINMVSVLKKLSSL